MSDSDRGVIGGRYQVIASLGRGGMGQVYKAYDPILDRTVALKKMIATVVDSEEGRQRFYIEARAAARLNHPNIVTIHELEEYSGDIYIVMELLDGVSLAAFMRQRVNMPLPGYLTILAQIAEGLHYAHKRAIVHRDIKPPNLVLTTSGNVKILDFGIARLASNEITKKGKLLGTPHYMAPEQVTEEAVDMRADLFSLGAVAYELVTGIKPFAADTIPALLMQITSTPHRPVLEVAPQTEPALAAIIDRLLAKDRTTRFGTGMEVVTALDLIGEIDRIDYVADAVAAVMGPFGEATIYAPIGSTPQPSITPPSPSSSASSVVPPLFSATPPIPMGTPMSATATPATPASATPAPATPTPATPAFDDTPPFGVAPPAAASASSDAQTLVDVQASTTPDVPPRRGTRDTMVGAPPSLPETIVAPAATPPAPPSFAPVTPPPVVMPSPNAAAKAPTASAPPLELADTLAAVPPPLPGGAAASGVTPNLDSPAAPTAQAAADGAMPSHAATPSNVPPSAPARAAASPSIPAPAAPAAAASADAKAPAASAPRGFVNTGVPQARHRSGAGAAMVVVGLLLLPAVVATGWWAFNSVRGALQTGTTATDTTSPAAVKDADPATQKPAEQQATTTDPANQAAQEPAKPTETPTQTPTETASQQQPPRAPAVDASAATSTAKPPEGEQPARPADASQTANASQTSQPNPALPANQANANQANIATRDLRNVEPTRDVTREPGREPSRDAVTDRTRETAPDMVVRDATRENTRRPAETDPARPAPPEDARAADANREPREPQPPQREPAPPVREEPRTAEPSTPADTRSLDYGSLSAFRGGSRSTDSASSVYSDSPSTAAAVARITYALEAYGDAIAARDLDALRDVRSPVTPAETTMLKEGRLTVRFSNLDVSLNGNDARVRCRREVVANGKTLSSGPADVRLTRRPEGWVITDIR